MATPTRISMTSAVVCGDEEEQVFIASARGRNGPKDPYTPERAIRNFIYGGSGSGRGSDIMKRGGSGSDPPPGSDSYHG